LYWQKDKRASYGGGKKNMAGVFGKLEIKIWLEYLESWK
jgi:hypothetical protein